MSPIFQNLAADLTFALRQLRRAPGFAVTAILTLALGIGANTSIFSLLDQALLRTLPVQHPSELVILHATSDVWSGSASSSGGDDNDYFSYPMYKDLRDRASGSGQNQAFSGMLATTSANAGFVRNNSSRVIDAELVSTNYFDVLGVRPALGRVLSPVDEGPINANPVIVLSYDFWRTQLAADPAILNSIVTLNGHPFTVVGVAAPAFHSAIWGQTPEAFVPMAMRAQITSHSYPLSQHDARWLNIIARLKPGVSSAHAEASLAPLWHALRVEELKDLGTKSPHFTSEWLGTRLQLHPGARGFSYLRPNVEKPFLALMGMAALVLLISAVNVASLLLVRSAGRIKEFSLRTALGARSGRILVQLLLEGLLIGIGGGLAGIMLAPIAIRALVNRISNPDSQNPLSASLDLRLLAFNFGVAILVSLVFSLAPALQLRRLNIVTNLRESSSTGSGSLLTLRRFVVCAQIGLSVILLVASGLFLRSMQNLRALDPGFNTTHLVTFDVDPTLAGYKPDQMPALHQRLLQAFAALPGVQAVAATDDAELAGNHARNSIDVANYKAPPDSANSVETGTVTPNYFQAMQIPFLAGRPFTESDDLDHPKVTIVNQSFVNRYCNGVNQACLGRMIGTANLKGEPQYDTQIVGIVKDIRHGNLREDIAPGWYRPLLQIKATDDLTFYLRHFGNPALIETALRTALHQVDRGLAPTGLRTMDEQIDQNLLAERLIALLAAAFGILATVLAGIGLYGVLAFSTQQRTREVGIRMALGSTRLAVSSLILKDVLKLAALGILLSLPIAYGLSKLVQTQLYGVSGADPVILVSVVAIIAAVAVLAALIPARRAASTNPTTALRTD